MFIGHSAIVLPNVNIGDDVIIGAGAIVTKDIPPNSVVAGVPARVICSTDDYRGKILSVYDDHIIDNYSGKSKAEMKQNYNHIYENGGLSIMPQFRDDPLRKRSHE